MSFPPVVAIKMVNLLSSMLIKVDPVVRDTLLNLIRKNAYVSIHSVADFLPIVSA